MERAELKQWLRDYGCAEERGAIVFLRDPHWSDSDRAVAEGLMMQADAQPAPVEEGWLCIRTGGSGGGFKFARHDEHTLGAAVEGFRRHFGLNRVSTVGVLPPWHVSGLMARVRCAASGGEYVNADWKAIEAGVFPDLRRDRDWVLSLVPTQLQRLVGSSAAVAWLQRFRIIFLGGGATWPKLADAAAKAGLRISMGYGMTETAAMVTGQRPEEFLGGDRSAGAPLPHAQLRIDAEGRVVIRADSMFRGYFPSFESSREYQTQDLGRIDMQGRLHLHGRRDAMIITGGKKVQPLEVEAALRASGEFDDVAVVGVPDPEWGEAVVACYPERPTKPDLTKAVAKLASYQRPKRFVALADWPRTVQGKINRAALVARVLAPRGDA